jgi:branched-chain amino acid aminotransferase
MPGVVETFEIEPGSFKPWGRHASLSEASSRLPAGSYTTLRTYGGDRVLRLEQHVRRLEQSLEEPATLAVDLVRRSLAAALQRTSFPESRFRLTFAPPRLFASVEEFIPLEERLYVVGVRCASVGVRRENPHAKDTRFIAAASRAYSALPAGVLEGLMLAEDGTILEGLSSNFFAVRNGALCTEDERVLPGVTRAIVLELADALLPVAGRALPIASLGEASEAFLTSVSREVLPVIEIDGRVVGDGVPGPVTQELRARFQALVAREAVSLRLGS